MGGAQTGLPPGSALMNWPFTVCTKWLQVVGGIICGVPKLAKLVGLGRIPPAV